MYGLTSPQIYNLVYIYLRYDYPGKMSKDKIIIIFLSGVNYVLLDSNATNIINITMLISTIAIVIGIYYKINKYAKVIAKQ